MNNAHLNVYVIYISIYEYAVEVQFLRFFFSFLPPHQLLAASLILIYYFRLSYSLPYYIKSICTSFGLSYIHSCCHYCWVMRRWKSRQSLDFLNYHQFNAYKYESRQMEVIKARNEKSRAGFSVDNTL